MASRFCSWRLSLPLACALLGGCSGVPIVQPHSPHAVDSARELREKEMRLTFVGHSYPNLLQALGAPGMVMSIPAFHPWNTWVVVYEGLDPASGCIDAFVVAETRRRLMVSDYFCR